MNLTRNRLVAGVLAIVVASGALGWIVGSRITSPAEAAARAVVRFVRDSHASGKKNVLIIHGRGNGSLRGLAVLKDVVVDALTESGASRLVLAFSSAPRRLGGVGALAVRLGER